MTDGERRAYGRGYNAGSRHAWPQHRPPVPPDEMISELLRAAQQLRDAADTFLATLLPDDEMVDKLGPGIDAVDVILDRMAAWVRSPAIDAGRTGGAM